MEIRLQIETLQGASSNALRPLLDGSGAQLMRPHSDVLQDF